jgi:hypothetical protein
LQELAGAQKRPRESFSGKLMLVKIKALVITKKHEVNI